ncbi:MAG: BatD family protein [Sulfurimonas sp.]|nr:BatD family protein [Sulfurimonas sp.]
MVKYFLHFFFLQNNIYALAVASVDASTVELGDMVTLSIQLDGEDIQRPNIFSICGENVVSTSSNTSIAYINGDYKKHYILSYKFIPTVSCTIEPIEISIAGQVEKNITYRD